MIPDWTNIIAVHEAAAGTGNGTVIPVLGRGGVSIEIKGTFTATITFEAFMAEAANGDRTWSAIPAMNRTTGISATTATAAGLYFISAAGFSAVRARISAYTDGDITANAIVVPIMAAPNDVFGAGDATAGKQDTGNTHLATIAGAVKADDAAFTPGTSPVMVMGAQADETSTDSVNEGDAGGLRMTLDRRLLTADAGPGWTSSFGVGTPAVAFTSADATTAAAVTAAPTAGQKLVITDIIVSSDTAMFLLFHEESTAGNILWKVFVPANGTAQFTPRGKTKLWTADKKLMVDASAAGNISVTCCYYSEA